MDMGAKMARALNAQNVLGYTFREEEGALGVQIKSVLEENRNRVRRGFSCGSSEVVPGEEEGRV
jgi:hypothetical protein